MPARAFSTGVATKTASAQTITQSPIVRPLTPFNMTTGESDAGASMTTGESDAGASMCLGHAITSDQGPSLRLHGNVPGGPWLGWQTPSWRRSDGEAATSL